MTKRHTEMQKYIEEVLLNEPVIPTNFELGEEVIFVNSYGVVFQSLNIIGFSVPDSSLPNRHIHLGDDSYWFPVAESMLLKKDDLKSLLRIFSPSKGYVGLDDSKDFIWVNEPAEAELFSYETANKFDATAFNPGSPDSVYVCAEGCSTFNP